MTSNCGKMSLLLPVIVMLVQTVYSTPNTELADIDPFDNIPEELKSTGWTSEKPQHLKKLAELALIGLNKIRAANGVTVNLEVDELYLMNWSGLVSEVLGKSLAVQGIYFTTLKIDPSEDFFAKIYDYKKEEQAEHNTVSTSDLLVETIRNWYKKAQTDVKNGVTKESLPVLDPKIVKFGVGFNKSLGEATYYNCLMIFATQDELDHFKQVIDDTTPEADDTTPAITVNDTTPAITVNDTTPAITVTP